jgi:hypothetical protein
MLLLGFLPLSGCVEALDLNNCENTSSCPTDAWSDREGNAVDAGDAHVADEGAASDAGSEEVVRPCDASRKPAEDDCVIDDKYGIFVSPVGSDTAGGTRAAPLKTIGKGLQVAKLAGKYLYVCDNNTGYSEPVTIDAALDGVVAFGGFTCADWKYGTTNHAKVKAASPALLIKSVTAGVTLENFEFDAEDATAPGGSSIGAIVDSAAKVTLRRLKILSGKGAIGQAGIDGAKGDDAPPATVQQQGIPAACPGPVATQPGGLWQTPSECGSLGGPGGDAKRSLQGSPGTAGIPQANVTPPDIDNGGARGATGEDGRAGSPGNAGTLGMVGTGSGRFSNVGYAPARVAGSGTDGFPGQGGGGGGASNATGTCVGASGGAGGMGGCGGKSGSGGGAGGASVALLSWMSTTILDACELVASEGGPGGKGGNGGPSGSGKEGAEGGAAYTADAGPSIGKGGHGGRGGDGGPGGSGAGGNGGPSYALVSKGAVPSKIGGTVLTAAAGGTKGLGGSVETTKAPDGSSGPAAMEFQAQ